MALDVHDLALDLDQLRADPAARVGFVSGGLEHELVRLPPGSRHEWVPRVVFAEHGLRFGARIPRELLLDAQERQRLELRVAQHDLAAFRECRAVGHRQRDRDRPQRAVREAHLGQHPFVVGAAHETPQRRKRAGGEQLEVVHGPVRQRERRQPADAGERFGARFTREQEVDKFSAVGRLQRAHAWLSQNLRTADATRSSASIGSSG